MSDAAPVFFYGLFMDAEVLAAQDIQWLSAQRGYVDGYGLRLGERATLQPADGERTYGRVALLATSDLDRLYGEPSVAAYRAETVSVICDDGDAVSALCYNLPGGPSGRLNRTYAAALLEVVTSLGFPQSYRAQIQRLL